MRNSSNRILLACVYIGVLTLIVACSPASNGEQGQAETFDPVSNNQQVNEDSLVTPPKLSISRISFISQDGMEVEVDPGEFERKWEKVFPDLMEEQLSGGQPLYTAISWDKQGQPIVFQLYQSGLKIGQDFFSGEAYQSFFQWVREYLGAHYFENLNLERMTLQALDIGMKAQVPEEKASDLFDLIQQAVLQKGDVRISSPLYPYFQLDIEYGGKDYLSFDVITPTLIALQDGQDQWYYQLNQSLFSELAEVIPLQDYAVYHIKHLFQAEGISIQDEDVSLHLNTEIEDQLKVRAYIHALTRQLAGAQPTNLLEKVGAKEEMMLLTFTFSNEKAQQVQLYENYFIYSDQLYDLPDAREKINQIVANIHTQ